MSNIERPVFADTVVGFLGDSKMSHRDMVDKLYCLRGNCTEAALRMRLELLSTKGIITKTRMGNKVYFKVSKEEKARCLNLAREANKDCKEWTQGLSESWKEQSK